ncbi:MAG: T9SS type A sorting domain-containing protein, partial [Elusimicrobia bacterium]|nr:T9SS type A sorting domain-containing protein [Elusimicrobiota bacterium]
VWSEEIPYAANVEWILPMGNGQKIVYALVKNKAGIFSESVSDEIELADDSGPIGTPSKPTIVQDPQQFNRLKVSWDTGTSKDPDTGISGYYCEVGTKEDPDKFFGSNVGLIFSQTVNISGLDAVYARVRAVNGAGLAGSFSEPSTSFNLRPYVTPTITSIKPGRIKKRSEHTITIHGQNFFEGDQIWIEGEGITVDSVSMISNSELKAHVVVDHAAVTGLHTVTLKNTYGVNIYFAQGLEIIEGFAEEAGQLMIQGGPKGYVNPELGETAKIYFMAETRGTITITIYSLTGKLVWKTEKQTDGNEDYVVWDCINNDGAVVSSGVYIVYLKGPGVATTRKMAIVR